MIAECGADVDLVDSTAGETPLYYAIRSSSKTLVQFLIDRGVNIDHRSTKQLSPYMLAKRHADKEII